MDLHKLYNENADFKGYVDRYCTKYTEGKSITIDEALTHMMVKVAAKYYKNQNISDQKKTGTVSNGNGIMA